MIIASLACAITDILLGIGFIVFKDLMCVSFSDKIDALMWSLQVW